MVCVTIIIPILIVITVLHLFGVPGEGVGHAVLKAGFDSSVNDD